MYDVLCMMLIYHMIIMSESTPLPKQTDPQPYSYTNGKLWPSLGLARFSGLGSQSLRLRVRGRE